MIKTKLKKLIKGRMARGLVVVSSFALFAGSAFAEDMSSYAGDYRFDCQSVDILFNAQVTEKTSSSFITKPIFNKNISLPCDNGDLLQYYLDIIAVTAACTQSFPNNTNECLALGGNMWAVAGSIKNYVEDRFSGVATFGVDPSVDWRGWHNMSTSIAWDAGDSSSFTQNLSEGKKFGWLGYLFGHRGDFLNIAGAPLPISGTSCAVTALIENDGSIDEDNAFALEMNFGADVSLLCSDLSYEANGVTTNLVRAGVTLRVKSAGARQ